MVFYLHLKKFGNNSEKVMFASTYLRGNAFSWFQPHISRFLKGETDDKETNKIFGKFNYFEDKLKQIFGNIDEG